MKKITAGLIVVLIIALSIGGISFGGCEAKKDADQSKQLVGVNNMKVTENALNTRISIFKMFYGPTVESAETKTKILDQLVEEALLVQDAAQLKITVSPEELKKEYGLFSEQLQGQYESKEKMAEELKTFKLTDADLKAFIERYLLIQGVYKKVTEKIDVTAQELSKYYDEHKTEFVDEESVKARHILVQTKEEAQKILSQLKSGVDFPDLAKKSSIDPGSKESGGELPVFARGEMYEEFETVAFSLEPGKLSGVVQTPAGYHVIKLEQKFPEKQQAFEEVKDQIKEFLLEERRGEAFDKYITDLQAKAKINRTTP